MKTYIAPISEDGIESLPEGVQHIESGLFAITSGDMPEGFREATPEETATPEEVIASMSADIELAADDFQTMFLGATTAKREQRFALNLATAKRLLAGGYTNSDLEAADLYSMQSQSTAQDEGRTPAEFAQWIVEWESKSVTISGAIEAFLKQAKMSLPNMPYLIDPQVQAEFKVSLRQQAVAMFESLNK